MLVVADSSPINTLIRIGCVEILPKLFGAVLIPPEVRAELSDSRTPEAVRRFVADLPGWLQVRPPSAIEAIPPLGRGEAAAISLAREVKADALLIDERDGRRAAAARGIAVIGTLGVLEAAATRGIVEFPAVVESLRNTDFRIDRALVDAALERHRQRTEAATKAQRESPPRETEAREEPQPPAKRKRDRGSGPLR